jgi:hypothetical protein
MGRHTPFAKRAPEKQRQTFFFVAAFLGLFSVYELASCRALDPIQPEKKDCWEQESKSES